ncbi:L,D-transpeptidase family protein [Dinghuibacter silviterrae]|uniref:Murein L,D-transpeptidase YcbB/YkuD n=1 Tax=Dinghuibacter silviterrae TaxID=1539049 RepID=A0A4R8DT10_9BACT|nr:L,D-transpeptidase family protein [Dinghuibacter silviterrae]TDX01016.1 murein L,D-transpeptidase YcbB/YkuD [Dinghuibacter silviterrae]
MVLSQNGRAKGFVGLIVLLVLACHGKFKEVPKHREIVEQPKELSERTADNIRVALSYAEDNDGKVNDSIRLEHLDLLKQWYEGHAFSTAWVHPPALSPLADSLYAFLEKGMYAGLFPGDYHGRQLASIRERLQRNTFDDKDAVLWSLQDLLLTDAFVGMTHDLAFGRIPRDTTTLRKDSAFTNDQYLGFLSRITGGGQGVSPFLDSLQPALRGYRSLREALGNFLDSARFQQYTHIDYPDKDTLNFYRQLLTRFKEEGLVSDSAGVPDDSVAWSRVIKTVQKAKGLKPDGIPGPMLVKTLNLSDYERVRIAALNLDRYKLLPDSASMPKEYVWVNLPGFYLQVWRNDSLQFQSKVIVGHAATRTPVLTSRLSNFVTYPVWTVPESIIYKEMLPKIKHNVGYLTSQNLVVVNDRDSVLNPYALPWQRYSKNNFPYRIRQLEGNDNSLGVIKFNFPNKYSVYLHDTNERDLFANNSRDLSHGCVRVQDWKALSGYLVRNDKVRYPMDTIKAWIARSEKHTVYFNNHVYLFLRYFTCDGKDGRLVFYDDIYGDDKRLLDGFFKESIH